MDITAAAAASIAMHQSRLQQAVSISVIQKVMDSQKTQGAALVEELRQAVPPPTGQQLDVLV